MGPVDPVFRAGDGHVAGDRFDLRALGDGIETRRLCGLSCLRGLGGLDSRLDGEHAWLRPSISLFLIF